MLGQQRADFKRYLAWAGQHATIEGTSAVQAGDYVTFLRTPASAIALSTARRQVSTLSTLWQWLIERGHAEANPWRGHSWKAKNAGQGSSNKGRAIVPDAALVALLTGAHDPRSRYRHVLHDLIKLALVTGARREELCGLRCEDVEHRHDGWWLQLSRV